MQKIGIIDFGGQYTHLIARRIRELGIYSEILHPNDFVNDASYIGIIFSGSPHSVTDEELLSIPININNLKVPLLGICYGHQLIARLLHGEVESLPSKEYGQTTITIKNGSLLFSGMDERQSVWMSHGDSVVKMPEGFAITGTSYLSAVTAFENRDRNIFGVQFHPEVTHSVNGLKVLDNFISLCTATRDWKVNDYTEEIIASIRKEAAGKKLLLLISGGIDSLVALVLCIKAVGNDNVFSIHVDTGFMRKNESSEVMDFLHELHFENIKIVDAKEKFFNGLNGITDPEEKRKIIGGLFVDVMHEELAAFHFASDNWMLVQGTIYPDTIESGGTKTSSTIKTHHNRVPEIEQLIEQGRVIEPLKELYKDEIRKLASSLNLPAHLVQRRPFPGPGLAIRILAWKNGEAIDETYVQDLPEMYRILANADLHGMVLPVKSVGVQGDFRTYRHPIVLWTENGNFPGWGRLKACTGVLINKLQSISRTVYSVVPLTEHLEVRETLLTEEQVALLQEVDAIVHERTVAIADIWQLPVVSLPLYDAEGKQAFVIRPVCSQDAMTADVYEMDIALLESIVAKIQEKTGAGYVFYDLTTKPPATIEWE